MEDILSDTNILEYESLSSPAEVIASLPPNETVRQTVLVARQTIKNILDGNDKRKLMIVGPCSIHDVDAGLDYARKLVVLAGEVKDSVYIVMRTYLEKPRSTVGWKGLLYDPDLNDSLDIEKGILVGRKFLLDVNGLGLPCANEFVRTGLPQYTADLTSWAAIGARTVESQTHRELASGLSMPVGLKNNTAGDISSAVDACVASRSSHTFLGLTMDGKNCTVRTKGNKYGHIVLRGANGKPNYYPEKVAGAISLLTSAGLPLNIIIDCSHANCAKIAGRQEEISYNILQQIKDGNSVIKGIMLESNIHGENQPFPKTLEQIKNLKYGVSVTDPCLDFESTERIVRKWAEELRK
ncbi:MAG: 3-deoxy-7-phosphoheptulonate synthase [archaeon]